MVTSGKYGFSIAPNYSISTIFFGSTIGLSYDFPSKIGFPLTNFIVSPFPSKGGMYSTYASEVEGERATTFHFTRSWHPFICGPPCPHVSLLVLWMNLTTP